MTSKAQKNINTLLFDLDGTLIDSFLIHLEVFKITFAHFGIQLNEEDLDQSVAVRTSRGDPFATFHVRTLSGADSIDFSKLPEELRNSFRKKTKKF